MPRPTSIVADPAVGTGTFLLGVLRRIAATVADDQGAGAVRGAIEAAAKRIIGFEMQFGPFAVAQLRLIAEIAGADEASTPLPELRLFITDTLGNPFIEEEMACRRSYEPVAKSRRDANKIKKERADHGRDRQSAIQGEGRRPGRLDRERLRREARLRRSTLEAAAGMGRRRARQAPQESLCLFLALGDLEGVRLGQLRSDWIPDKDEEGIVCFITVAGFLNGPGFQKMRDDLRRTCSEIWVIDCSPEGHQPEVRRASSKACSSRCASCSPRASSARAATSRRSVRFRACQRVGARRSSRRSRSCRSMVSDWVDCLPGWRDPFLPGADGSVGDISRAQ